jgi:hypothetical protein
MTIDELEYSLEEEHYRLTKQGEDVSIWTMREVMFMVKVHDGMDGYQHSFMWGSCNYYLRRRGPNNWTMEISLTNNYPRYFTDMGKYKEHTQSQNILLTLI